MSERQVIESEQIRARAIRQRRQQTMVTCIKARLGDSQAPNIGFWYLLTASIQGVSYLIACLLCCAWLVIRMRKKDNVS